MCNLLIPQTHKLSDRKCQSKTYLPQHFPLLDFHINQNEQLTVTTNDYENLLKHKSEPGYTVNSLLRAPPPIRAPPLFLTPNFMCLWTFLAISQPKKVRFSFCKKPLEAGTIPFLMIAPHKGLPGRPAPLLENLR